MEGGMKPRNRERGGQLLEYAVVLAFVLVLAMLAADHASSSGFSVDNPLGRTVGVLEGIVGSLSRLFRATVGGLRSPLR